MARKLQRIQKIVLPILRGHDDLSDRFSSGVPGLEGVTVSSWMENIDLRDFPQITIRRIGGGRNPTAPTIHALPVIEMTAYGTVDLETTEDLYEDALEALYLAVKRQTSTPSGCLSSIKENMGATQFDSPFPDSWRVQGLIQLGNRARRNRS